MNADIIIEVHFDDQRGQHFYFSEHIDARWVGRTVSFAELGEHLATISFRTADLKIRIVR